MISHVNFVLYNPRTKKRRRNITYFKKNGITTLKKHLDANHVILAKRFEEEVNFPLRNILEKQPIKKRPNVFNSKILEMFWCKRFFKDECCATKAIFARSCPFGC
jgi:hypothetical protein